MEKEITISDVWIASFITAVVGIQPTLKIQNQLVVFCFPENKKVAEAIKLFQMDYPVPVYSYVRAYKNLKASMINLKILSEGKGNEKV